jgi:uroporphyrinogen decarboxylase
MATKGKATMTDKERVAALLRRERPDRVPIWPMAAGFPMVYTRTSIADAYNKPEVSLAAQRKTARDFGWLFMPLIAYAAFGGWEFGGEIKWPSGEFAQAPTVLKHAVATPDDVMKLKVPDVKTAGIIPLVVQFCTLAAKEELDNKPFSAVLFMEGTFNTAANIVGVDTFARWLLKKPEAAHRLLRLAADFQIELASYYKDTFGTEGAVLFGGEPSSSNQVISPRQFEEFALPYLKETHQKTLAMGFKTFLMHICGEQNANLPYWAEVPMGDPGLVSFGHEVELETAAQYFPNDIIVGNLEPAIIQTKTADEVYQAASVVITQGKKLANGFILAPGCELPPMAPVENVKAITRAVNDFGWYD